MGFNIRELGDYEKPKDFDFSCRVLYSASSFNPEGCERDDPELLKFLSLRAPRDAVRAYVDRRVVDGKFLVMFFGRMPDYVPRIKAS